MAQVMLDIARPGRQELHMVGDGIDLTQPFVSDKLNFRDFVLLESAWSAEYAPFDEYADNSIFPVNILAKLASGDKELRKETVAKLTEAAGLWGVKGSEPWCANRCHPQESGTSTRRNDKTADESYSLGRIPQEA